MSPFSNLTVLWIIPFLWLLPRNTQGLVHFSPEPITPSLPFVLQQAGSTVFRPGGTAATHQLRHWADTDDILEISPSTPTTDQEDLPPQLPETSFHAAILVEAILTHQPNEKKEKILQSLSSHTHQLLLHDVCLLHTADQNATAQMRQDMANALGTGFYALSVDEWKQLVQRNGYRVMECQQGHLQSMSPKILMQDEGWSRAFRIVWNIVTHKTWRERVKRARTTMASYNDSLGYILLRAAKENNTVYSN